MKSKILLVDDSEEQCELVKSCLKKNYDVTCMTQPQMALQLVRKHQFDLIISDLQMPSMNGLELMRFVREIYPSQTFLILTAHGSIDNAVEAMKFGAFDYVQKPFSSERIQMSVKNALEFHFLKDEVKNLREYVDSQYPVNEIIGSSNAIKMLSTLLRKTYSNDANVMIIGESGTGKELVARNIHKNDRYRADEKFVAVNCAAISETLLESELFGHEKGAFTGANERKIGKFEYANGGTLFLDEISEMNLSMQAKLLRVLQEREIQRLGSNETIKIKVRVISATNRDIKEQIKKGLFREDLFYRLNTFEIFIPALRQRTEDISELAYHFLQLFNRKALKNKTIKKFSKEALELLENYSWPGNVRELQNVIERAVLDCETDCIDLQNLPHHFQRNRVMNKEDLKRFEYKKLQDVVGNIERDLIQNALKLHNYNISEVAKSLGIGRTTLYRKAEQYQIDLKIHI